ncbi:rhomboid-like protein 14, mitochondrial [Cryptomeria japonica]|uniref:rhomboid-like protein 14, mitochondrial n=1 Tax=Cryptomeria japonica TaxID=3369 RepID=UPI0027DAB344|nr:rhomboid-like protein 14, mitochondrial [Cryptomeria japonica]
MNRGRGRGRNRGMLYLLAMQVASEYFQMERKPPVTATLIAANTLVYLRPGVLDDLLPSLSEVCLHPHLVIKNRDIKRLFFSAFYHVDDSHLAYNMLSLLWKGVQLERMMGSTEFASAVVVLLGMSHGIEVILAKMLATFFDYPHYYFSECSVGFSAVLFALKVILSSDSPGYTNVYGLIVPARHAAWTELLLIQMFVPGVSFLGHLSGIISGLLYLWSRRFFSRSNPFTPMLRKFTWFVGLPYRLVQGYLNRYRRHTYGRGTVGGRSVPRSIGNSRAENVNAVWRCPACTFDNNIHLEVCEICATRRGNTDVSPSAPPLSQTETRISSHDLSLEELRRRRLERFSR